MNDWNDAQQRFERALELFQQRKWPQALEELKLATTINPFNGSWFFNLGLVLDEMGRHEEALGAYRRADQIEPNNLHILERIGLDLTRTNRLRQALRTFGKMSAIDSSHEPAYCHRIMVYDRLGKHELAEEMFYTARLYKDHCPRCYEYMGRSLASRGLNAKAIYCFQKCLDLDEAWPGARRGLARTYWNQGDFEQARRHYLADLRQNPGRTQTILDLGQLLGEMGLLEEAGEKFRRCIELAPENPDGHWRYGRWLVRHHKYEQAEAAFNQALRLDSTFHGVHLELARLAFRRGEGPATRVHLRAEHRLGPQDAALLLGLANLWMDCGGYRTAIACLKRLIDLQPRNADAWLNLGVAQFRRGLYEAGILSCRRALALDERNRLAMFNLALAYERLGQLDRAWDLAKNAMELEPGNLVFQRLELRLRVLNRVWTLISKVRRALDLFI